MIKSARRSHTANRKIPATIPMLERLGFLHRDTPCLVTAGLFCAAVVGFFFLLRIGEMEQLRWNEVSVFYDDEGDMALNVTIPRSETDQFNQGHEQVSKSRHRRLCPVLVFQHWSSLKPLIS